MKKAGRDLFGPLPAFFVHQLTRNAGTLLSIQWITQSRFITTTGAGS
jgi:hypothetical protein